MYNRCKFLGIDRTETGHQQILCQFEPKSRRIEIGSDSRSKFVEWRLICSCDSSWSDIELIGRNFARHRRRSRSGPLHRATAFYRALCDLQRPLGCVLSLFLRPLQYSGVPLCLFGFQRGDDSFNLFLLSVLQLRAKGCEDRYSVRCYNDQ
jgi:hypothetical protein